MNFLYAILIGAAVGIAATFVVKQKQSNAMTRYPAVGALGALVASVLAAIFGDTGYGWQEAVAQIVFAAAGVVVLAVLAQRSQAAAPPAG